MNYDWNFLRLKPYTAAFIAGTITTVELTIVIIVLGTICGVALGLLMRKGVLRLVLYPLIDVVRAVPPLVLLLFCYFFFTRDVIGWTLSTFWVCAIALSVNLAAFTSDLVRAALDNVPSGEIEAGLALGMTEKQVRAHVVLPHLLRQVLPGLTVLYIGMLKATSLASVISVRDLVFTAQVVITRVARSLETWIVVALIYVALVVPATYGARALERWSRRGRPVPTA